MGYTELPRLNLDNSIGKLDKMIVKVSTYIHWFSKFVSRKELEPKEMRITRIKLKSLCIGQRMKKVKFQVCALSKFFSTRSAK